MDRIDMASRLRRLALPVVVAVFAVGQTCWADGPAGGLAERWGGLHGEGLKRAVAGDCRPATLVDSYSGVGGFWEIVRLTDVAAGGDGYLNRFSAEVLSWPPSLEEGPREMVLVNVVPPAWWDSRSGVQHDVQYDMYNMVPALPGVSEQKGVYPLGTVTDAFFSNGFWSVGYGIFDGVNRHLWQPPVGYEGDFARIVFYMFTVCPDGLISFGLNGALYVDESYYPGISVPALRQLLTWHRNDPPDGLERRRNEVFSRYQGNVNPFVELPDLAEYLWGNRIGLPYGGNGPAGAESATPPLKATYSLSELRINLHSAYVPADAVWSVDGREVRADFLVPADLGIGVHELRFSGSAGRGKVLIEVVP